MTNDLIELAEKEGFKQGWHDGHAGTAQTPCPDIGFNLFEPGYVKHFNAAYYDAYETARDEKERRAELKERRDREHADQRER